MVEEDKDESPHENTDKTDEEAQDMWLAFDNDLDSEVNDLTIEEGNCIFMAMVHSVDPHHFVCALSMVSGENLNTRQTGINPQNVQCKDQKQTKSLS
jgi:hypothetical protein